MTDEPAGGRPSPRGVGSRQLSYSATGGQRAGDELVLDGDRGQRLERRARETMSDAAADQLVAMFAFDGGEE
jgi:hypothetical protein